MYFCGMKRMAVLLSLFFISKALLAFNFRIGIDDADSGFFIVTGDDAIFGIFSLLSCLALAGISYFLAEKIGERENGILKYVYWILMLIGFLAVLGTIFFAFSMWWFTLILVAVVFIGTLIYGKIKGDI